MNEKTFEADVEGIASDIMREANKWNLIEVKRLSILGLAYCGDAGFL